MKPLDESQFQAYLQKAGISIPDPTLQNKIGQELTFGHGPKRTFVVHFTKEDLPKEISAVLQIILSIHNEWILVPRFGNLSNWKGLDVLDASIALTFEENEKQPLCDLVVGHIDKMFQIGDDIYVCSTAGNTIISVDHHLFDDGLNIVINNIELSGQLLQRLNTYGAELEVYFVNG